MYHLLAYAILLKASQIVDGGGFVIDIYSSLIEVLRQVIVLLEYLVSKCH